MVELILIRKPLKTVSKKKKTELNHDKETN